MARKVHRPADPEQQRRTRKRLILAGVLGVVALALLAGLVFTLRLTGGPALPREVRERLRAERQQGTGGVAGETPAPRGPAGETPAPRGPGPAPRDIPPGTPPLRQQVQQVQQAARSGDTAVRTLYISDAELNAEIAQAIGQQQQVRDARAYFTSEGAYFVANIELKGRPWNLTLRLTPRVSNGGVRFDVASAHVGQIAAPDSVVQKIQEELNKKGDLFDTKRTGLYVEKIELRPGVAILTGRPTAVGP
jgi:hypothetical protein